VRTRARLFAMRLVVGSVSQFARVEAIALLAAVVVLAGAYWWSHPNVLDHGSGLSGDLEVGQAQYFSVADHLSGYDETIRVLRVKPHIVRDETAAYYEFLTCVLKDADRGLGAGDARDVSAFCASTKPTTGAAFGLQDGTRSQILMEVTPTKPGRLELEGVDVRYRRSGGHLFQTGTQLSGTTMKFTAK
jgi:hypothetical protein